MTNGDRIRAMSDEELNKFLWWFKVDSMSSFITKGGAGVMNAKEQRIWLHSEDDAYLEKLMHISEG